MMTLKQCKCTPKQIELAERYGLFSCEDILSLYPHRYDVLEAKPFTEWMIKDRVIFEGTLVSWPSTVRFGNKRSMTRFQIETEETLLHVTIFNRPWSSTLKVGMKLTVIGRYDGQSKVTALQYNAKPMEQQLGVIPVYPLKEGVKHHLLASLIKKVFMANITEIDDFIPSDLIQRYQLMNKKMALRCIHFPRSTNEVKMAYRTLKYEEFLKFHLAVLLIRNQEKSKSYSTGKKFDFNQINTIIDELPFECTPDQRNAINDILNDMQSDRIMYRLIQGDVGCGKTVVAWISMLACVMSNQQAAMMAPTEILAKQHYQSCLELNSSKSLRIEVLYSALSSKKKNEILNKLKNHEIDILIGTHALIQENVEFANLGLVVADEQHRFGVEQRRKLKEKGDKVDFLLMSATPIPRTLANTLYGDMDISTIVTMPKGRKPVKTFLIQKNTIKAIKKELNEVLSSSQQIYIICSAIDENENFDGRNITEVEKEVQNIFGSQYNIATLHGRMSSEEKELAMQRFSSNEVQILISTTVVEVGVNVVNATAMVILDAHRFGLSTLHQLRGRVQRGKLQGKCWLLTDSKDNESIKRLEVLVNSHDGFEISYQDLQMRGPGDILGVRQSGLPGFILGNLFEDTKIIETARKDALMMIEHEHNEQYQRCIEMIKKMNEDKISYMD